MPIYSQNVNIHSITLSSFFCMKTRQAGLLRSTMVVSLFTMISRVLGFVRDMVQARAFGASPLMDAFLIAFKIPNFMRRLFAEGAFSQAFVPILSEYQEQKNQKDLLHFLGVICGTLTSVLVALVILVELTAPLWIRIFAPGFEVDGVRYLSATHMLRWTFPYLAFISVTAFTSAVLNTFSRFAIPAATPIFLNITMISFVLWVSPTMDIPIYGLAVSVFVAGIIQCVFQWPFLMKLGLVFRPRINWRDPEVKRLLKQMVPALFGVSVAQINLLFDTLFASFLPVGSIGWLYYSDRLMNFPLGVFGVAIATVILPLLSRACAASDAEHYEQSIDWAIKSILLIGIPSAVGLIMLANQLLIVLFNYGHFSLSDVHQSSYSLVAFSLGVPAFMLVKVLASAFYAKQDISTPVRVGAVAMIANVILNLLLIKPLQHMGLAFATSVAGYLNVILLVWLLKTRQWYRFKRSWLKFLIHMFIAVGLMAAYLFGVQHYYPESAWADWHFGTRLYMVLLVVLGAFLTYFFVLFVFGYRLRDFKHVSDL